VHVVHNGIDTELFSPRPDDDFVRELGLDPGRPLVIFVGRITRQKGLPHLLRAAAELPPSAQLVLCASAPDTPQIATEVETAIERLSRSRSGLVWVREPVPRARLIGLLSSATVFVCPSVYEPLGIVNLEAMACGTAVVATAVGGIPEVVRDGDTGLLVPYDAQAPEALEHGLAAAITRLVEDRELADKMGRRGRERVVSEFGWPEIARRTVALYAAVVNDANA
jgi:starch synthase